MSDDYMEQCPYCKKFLLANQIKQHNCNSILTEVKEIPVMFSYETTDGHGKRVTIARGYDGVLYRLVRCKNPLADEKKQHFTTDEEEPDPV